MSAPILKVTVRLSEPSMVEVEDMYSMSSTPTMACSSGAATVSAMTLGLAPGKLACTTTAGGTTSGYSPTGRRSSASAPAMVMNAEITPAKMGRSMKKLEMFIVAASTGVVREETAIIRGVGLAHRDALRRDRNSRA